MKWHRCVDNLYYVYLLNTSTVLLDNIYIIPSADCAKNPWFSLTTWTNTNFKMRRTTNGRFRNIPSCSGPGSFACWELSLWKANEAWRPVVNYPIRVPTVTVQSGGWWKLTFTCRFSCPKSFLEPCISNSAHLHYYAAKDGKERPHMSPHSCSMFVNASLQNVSPWQTIWISRLHQWPKLYKHLAFFDITLKKLLREYWRQCL